MENKPMITEGRWVGRRAKQVMGIKCTCCDEDQVMYGIVGSLYYTSATNRGWYVHYIKIETPLIMKQGTPVWNINYMVTLHISHCVLPRDTLFYILICEIVWQLMKLIFFLVEEGITTWFWDLKGHICKKLPCYHSDITSTWYSKSSIDCFKGAGPEKTSSCIKNRKIEI